MSEPTIPAALDAGEWAERRLQFGSADGLVVHDDGDGLEFVVYPDADAAYARRDLVGKYKIEAWATNDLAALIALANAALPDEDPRKITRGLVQRLREAGYSAPDGYSPPTWLADLADALESYLPPKEPA